MSEHPEDSPANSTLPPRPASASRMSLAVLTHPGQANPFGMLHGGVMLHLADECGGLAALRHALGGEVATAAIDSLVFLGPVHVGERVEVIAEVSYVGRTSIETRIEIHAEPLDRDERRLVGMGYALYVAVNSEGHPRPVPPLLCVSEADRARAEQAQARQEIRLARRHEARGG